MSKRPADNDHGDHESKNIKREYENKSARYTTRLLIPTKFGGQLIGKGGQIAKDIRARHNVDMFIPDARGPERLVRIKTDDRQDLANCVREISEVLQEDMNKALKLKDGESEVRVLLHKSLVSINCLVNFQGLINHRFAAVNQQYFLCNFDFFNLVRNYYRQRWRRHQATP